uniref:hypothetical protein n=1 Tax=Alloprevotella sp. TaxID=1872471 RepID=UPI0040284580
RALPWATDLLGFQPAQGRKGGFFRTISIYLIFLYFEHHSFSRLITDDASGARRIRRWDVIRSSLVPDALAAGT